jgi:hypothetical protein
MSDDWAARTAETAACAACGSPQPYGRIRCLACGQPLVFPVNPYRDGAIGALSFVCVDCGAAVFDVIGAKPGTRCSTCSGYRDDAFAERPCDHCSKPYRGPAVYCSLACALADA